MSKEIKIYTDQDNHPLVKMALSLGYKNFKIFYRGFTSYLLHRGWHFETDGLIFHGWTKEHFISRMKEYKPKK